VNTVVNVGGRLLGHNTDAPGFLAALREVDFEPRGTRVTLLGAGGAARAIASALAEVNVGELYVVNRNSQRALILVQELIARFGARPYWAVPLDSAAILADHVSECDLIVNATTVGMHDDGSPLPLGLLRDGMLVMDIIYNPPRTRLLADATHVGARTQNGLPMLVHQAAEAFRLWTGQQPPLDVMRMAAAGALIGPRPIAGEDPARDPRGNGA
jgi:shikimate dehydrogenase